MRGSPFEHEQDCVRRPRIATFPIQLGFVKSGSTSRSDAANPGSRPGAAGPRPWPREVRLVRRSDFQRVYTKGSRHGNPLFVAFVLRTTAPASRIGFTTPRALGKAHDRNRIKRRMREAVRLHLPELSGGWDIVFNPRRAVLDAEFSRVEEEVLRLFLQRLRDQT